MSLMGVISGRPASAEEMLDEPTAVSGVTVCPLGDLVLALATDRSVGESLRKGEENKRDTHPKAKKERDPTTMNANRMERGSSSQQMVGLLSCPGEATRGRDR